MTEVRYETNVEERFEVVSGPELDDVVRLHAQHHHSETQSHTGPVNVTTTNDVNVISITNGEAGGADRFAMPPLNTFSGFQEERRKREEEEGNLSPTSESRHRRTQNTFFDSAFQDGAAAAAAAAASNTGAPPALTVTEPAVINEQQLAQALRNAVSDSDDDDDHRIKDIKLPTDSNDDVVITPVPKNTPVSAPPSTLNARRPLPATTYEDSESEEEDNEALKNARAAMASARVVAQVPVAQQQALPTPQPPAAAPRPALKYDSSDDEDSDNEAMKNAMAALNAGKNPPPASAPAPVVVTSAAPVAPNKPSPQASSQPSALIASLFNKKPEGESIKAQFANKTSTVDPPKPQSPVPQEPQNVRNFVIPGNNKTNSLVAAIQAQAESEGPSELETVQLQETNNLDKSTGELVNRHSMWEAEERERKEKEHHERLVALRPVEVSTPTPPSSATHAASSGVPTEELTGPARLVKLRSVANPNPIFVNDLAAAASQSSPMPASASTNKLSIDTTSSATPSAGQTPIGSQESRIPGPSPVKPATDAAAAGETETPTGPKRLVKLRSVAKMQDYGQPTKLPGPVANREASPMRNPTAAPASQTTPPPAATTTPKAVAPLVPAVPAPFVPSQSVKLKSTGSEKLLNTPADVPASPAAEASPSKPMFKLRSTGFGLTGPSTGGASSADAAAAPPVGSPAGTRPGLTHQNSLINKSGEYKPPASFVPKTATSSTGVSPLLSVKLRSTGILNNEVNASTTNEVHVKATVPERKNSDSNVPSQIVRLRSVAAARAAEEAGNESESMKGTRLDMNQ